MVLAAEQGKIGPEQLDVEPMGFVEAVKFGVAERIRDFREARADAKEYRGTHPEDTGFDWVAHSAQGESVLTPAVRRASAEMLSIYWARRNRDEGKPYDEEVLARVEAEELEQRRFRASKWSKLFSIFETEEEPVVITLP